MELFIQRTTRIHRRILADQKIVITHGDVIHSATLINCSEKGMYFKSGTSFPLDTILEIMIPVKDEALKVTVKVVRSFKTTDYEGIGVKLLNESLEYIDFLIDLYFGFVNFKTPYIKCS